jgi:hypothetical protein
MSPCQPVPVFSQTCCLQCLVILQIKAVVRADTVSSKNLHLPSQRTCLILLSESAMIISQNVIHLVVTMEKRSVTCGIGTGLCK